MKLIKRGTVLVYLMLSLILINPNTFDTVETVPMPETTKETTISPCSYAYEWVYKIIDGKLYKRLFNRTTGKWASDWIAV